MPERHNSTTAPRASHNRNADTICTAIYTCLQPYTRVWGSCARKNRCRRRQTHSLPPSASCSKTLFPLPPPLHIINRLLLLTSRGKYTAAQQDNVQQQGASCVILVIPRVPLEIEISCDDPALFDHPASSCVEKAPGLILAKGEAGEGTP